MTQRGGAVNITIDTVCLIVIAVCSVIIAFQVT